MKKFILFFLMFFCSSFLFAQSNSFKIKVNVVVAGDDVIKDQVESAIDQKLRTFSDVVLVTARGDPDYILSVLVIQTKQINGNPIGYIGSEDVIGRLLAKAFHKSIRSLIAKKRVDSVAANGLSNVISSYAYDLPVSSVLVDADLNNLVERIVAFADS